MNRNRKTAWLGLMTVAVGTCCLADLSAIAAETPGGNASAAEPAAERAPANGNLLRNAGFELDSDFNGSPMRQGTEFMRAVDLFRTIVRRRQQDVLVAVLDATFTQDVGENEGLAVGDVAHVEGMTVHAVAVPPLPADVGDAAVEPPAETVPPVVDGMHLQLLLLHRLQFVAETGRSFEPDGADVPYQRLQHGQAEPALATVLPLFERGQLDDTETLCVVMPFEFLPCTPC